MLTIIFKDVSDSVIETIHTHTLTLTGDDLKNYLARSIGNLSTRSSDSFNNMYMKYQACLRIIGHYQHLL